MILKLNMVISSVVLKQIHKLFPLGIELKNALFQRKRQEKSSSSMIYDAKPDVMFEK